MSSVKLRVGRACVHNFSVEVAIKFVESETSHIFHFAYRFLVKNSHVVSRSYVQIVSQLRLRNFLEGGGCKVSLVDNLLIRLS